MKYTCVRFLGILSGILLVNLCQAQTPPIFNVKDFGATGNGSTLDSPAVNNAISAANAAGGGTVTFPPGTYLCGSIHLGNCPNNLTLYLSNSAVIWGSASHIDTHESNPNSKYQDQGHSYFHDALIWGENLNKIAIAGPGKIDGHGALTTGNPSSSNPGDKALCLVECTGVTITGVTITNGGHFGILAQACTNMLVDGAFIEEKTSRDAFNLIDSSDAIVTNCLIEGSDDSMCLKSDYALGRKIGGSHIHISHCTILSTENNATQFGSETVGDFSDVTFSDITITGAGKAGIGITSQDGSVIDGVTYDNITMHSCATPIWMKLDHRTTDAPSPVPVGRIRNISINNVVATHSTLFGRAFTSTINGYFDGSGAFIPITDVVLNNVNVSNVGGQSASANNNVPNNNQDWQPQNFGSWPSYGWYLRYAKDIFFTNCQAHFDSNDNRAAFVAAASTNILLGGFTAQAGSSSPYDLRFTNTTDFEVVDAFSTTGSPLRVVSQNSSTASIVPAPDISPVDGVYSGPISVTLDAISGAAIHYTTDGSDPTSSSGTLYTGPFPVDTETTVKAIASLSGMRDSAVNTAIYQFTTATSNSPDFSISASPSSQSVLAGSGTSYTVTITATNGFGGTVSLGVSGLPSGATTNFNPATITGSGSSTLTVNTLNSTPPGTYTLTINGTGGGLSHSTTVTLVVNMGPNFSISATPSSQTVTAGSNTTYTVNIGSINGFGGTVSLNANGLPANATASFNPPSLAAPGSSTMTVTTTTSTPAGTSTLTITGTSGTLTNSTTVSMTVQVPSNLPPGWTDADIGAVGIAGSASFSGGTFTVSGSGADIFNPGDQFNYAYQSISGDQTVIARVVSENGAQPYAKAGVMIRESLATNSVNASVLLTPTNGVAMEVRTATGAATINVVGWVRNILPPRWVRLVRSGSTFTAAYSADGSTWTQIASTNVNMNTSATAGLAVTAHSNTQLNTANFDNVSLAGANPDFTLSASPNSLTIVQGTNGASTITVNPLNGFSGSVSLSASGLPNGVTASFNPSSTTTTSTLTLTAGGSATTGTTNVVVTGTSGSLQHTTTISLTVNAPNTNNFAGIFQIQNEASSLVLNNQGSLTNGSAITQWTITTSSNLDWQLIPTSNGYYQINSCKSALDAVVQGASTSPGAGIIQWSFGSAGNDQWQPVQNGDGSYTFFNLHSGLVLADPGSSTNRTTQMDQETSNGGSNQKWKLLKQ